jgi:hypothetical protein
MTIKFDISGTPPKQRHLDGARTWAKTCQFFGPLLVAGWLFGAWPFVTWAWQAYETKMDYVSLFLRLFFGGVIYLLTMHYFASVSRNGKALEYQVTPINPMHTGATGAILALSKEYPEIDAYRQKVVASRQITNGDLQAMFRFDEERKAERKEAAARAKEEADKAKRMAAYDAVNQKGPIREQRAAGDAPAH